MMIVHSYVSLPEDTSRFEVGHHVVHNSRAHPPFSDNLPDIVHELGTLKRGDWGY